MTSTLLRSLQSPPSEAGSQQHAQQVLAASVKQPILPAQMANSLRELLAAEHVKSSILSQELAASKLAVQSLLAQTKAQVSSILERATDLKESHEQLEDALIDHREALVSSLAQQERGQGDKMSGTLKERLERLDRMRHELESTRAWFAVLAKAEELGYATSQLRFPRALRLMIASVRLASLRALTAVNLPVAFEAYIKLVQYIGSVQNTAPALALTSHLVAMASSVWNSLVKALSE